MFMRARKIVFKCSMQMARSAHCQGSADAFSILASVRLSKYLIFHTNVTDDITLARDFAAGSCKFRVF